MEKIEPNFKGDPQMQPPQWPIESKKERGWASESKSERQRQDKGSERGRDESKWDSARDESKSESESDL